MPRVKHGWVLNRDKVLRVGQAIRLTGEQGEVLKVTASRARVMLGGIESDIARTSEVEVWR